MSLKTKILSLFLLGLLLLPAIIGPKQNGSVLGVIEDKVNSTTNKSPENVSIGEIGSGAFDVKNVDSGLTTGKVFEGKAVWDTNAKSQVITDKFTLGKSLRVSYKGKDLNLVVGDVRVLGSDTLLVLNRETFEKLGGNPDTDDSITVKVVAD